MVEFLAVLLLILLTAYAAGRGDTLNEQMKHARGQTAEDELRKRRAIWDANTGVGIAMVVILIVIMIVQGTPDSVWQGDPNRLDTVRFIGP